MYKRQDLTTKIDAKFEQSAAKAELSIAELTSKIEAQKVSLTEALEISNADINTEIKQTNKEIYALQGSQGKFVANRRQVLRI